MRKTIGIILLLCMLMLTACGQTVPVAEPQQESGNVQAPGSGSEIPAAETPLAPQLPSVEEQRSILEANRSLWAFDEGDYAPDWYYTFTDLDHNGLLEVISASTQGSGIFTYAHYYEVLPDGSGVKNLYHANVEIEGPDDWPEIIRDSLPCWHDSAADRYPQRPDIPIPRRRGAQHEPARGPVSQRRRCGMGISGLCGYSVDRSGRAEDLSGRCGQPDLRAKL